jgi:uncharacterized lipoprotein YmbA
MISPKPAFRILTIIALATLIGGCAVRSQPTNFYTLASTVQRQALTPENPAVRDLAIGIGPITLADYLDQSRIVTRIDDNAVIQAEFNQWSGSLKDNIVNVFADNVSRLTGTEKVFVYPWRSFVEIDYQVVLDIIRFDGTPEDQALVEARWTLLRNRDKAIIDIRRSSVREAIDAPGYGGLVAAQSRALATLSTEIVQSIIETAKIKY